MACQVEMCNAIRTVLSYLWQLWYVYLLLYHGQNSYIHTYIHAVQVAPIIEKVTKQGLWSRTILLVLVQAST